MFTCFCLLFTLRQFDWRGRVKKTATLFQNVSCILPRMLCTLEVEIMADSGELVVMWIDSDSWKNGVETISKTLVNLSWYNDRAPQIHFNRLKNYYKLSRPHGLSLPAKCFARESKYLPMGHTRTLVIHCKSPRILWDIKTATMNPDPRECNIKVFARFRPQSDAEIRAGGQNVVSSPTSDTCVHGVSPMMFLL